MTTLASANRAITKAGIPLELVRGDGYHYFVYVGPEENVLVDIDSVYVCYTNTFTAKQWVEEAASAMAKIMENVR